MSGPSVSGPFMSGPSVSGAGRRDAASDREYDVAVVGGGPVGLWLAAELHRAGVRPVVLERRAARPPHSKALTIYPRTVEQLAMRGIADRWLAEGRPVPSSHFALLKNRLDFAFLAADTRYPYTLFLPQRRTEELLEEHLAELGLPCLREHAVTGCRQDAAGVELDVDTPDGPIVIRARYAAGCDGAKSVLRDAAGIDWEGTPDTWQTVLGDIELTDPPSAPALTLDQPGGALYMVALGDGRHRVAVIDHATLFDPADRPVTFEDLRSSTRRVAGTDFGMRETPAAWLSRVGNATRQAARYRAGRVLLAGDAAHIHYPAGGQGLNLGLQDATNLAWKLAADLQGWAPPGLLDSYHDERYPVGLDVIDDSLAQCGLIANPSREGIALRDRFNRILGDQPALAQDLARRLSGLAIRYPPPAGAADPSAAPAAGAPGLGDPARGHPGGDPARGHPGGDRAPGTPGVGDPAADHLGGNSVVSGLVGRRVPDLDLRDAPAASVFGLLHPARFVLLILGAPAPAQAEVPSGYASRLDVVTARLAHPHPPWAGVRTALIRPDGYLAWATATDDPPPLAPWLGHP